MTSFPIPQPGAVFFEDKKLYATLAEFPITCGHVVVIWKKHIKDLGRLNKKDYDHLMNVVDRIRDVMMKVLKVKKVYLIYMDETQHVHWHLVPRYDEEGFDVFAHKPGKLEDVGLARKLEKKLK